MHADDHRRIQPVDVFTALALAGFCIAVARHQTLTEDDARPADLLQAFAIAGACLPLALRRPFPVVVAIVSSFSCGVYIAREYSGGPVLLVPLMAMFFAGYAALERDRVWRVVAAYTAILVAAMAVGGGSSWRWAWLVGWAPLAGTLAFAGAARRRRDIDAIERAAEEEQRQHAEALRQLAEERLRTARELHDVLGHSLASIALLAGAGSRRVADDPDSARDVLDEIREVSAMALADVRSALDALSHPTEAALAAGADDLCALLDRLRRVGLRIDERVDVDIASLDPVTKRGLHRVAQESLTNVMRHAGSLHASIVIEPVGGGVEMTVSDWGTTGSGEIVEGLGISGMRRRVVELGGQLTVAWGGEHGRGGLTVVAWLPTTPAVPAPIASPAVSEVAR